MFGHVTGPGSDRPIASHRDVGVQAREVHRLIEAALRDAPMPRREIRVRLPYLPLAAAQSLVFEAYVAAGWNHVRFLGSGTEASVELDVFETHQLRSR